MKTLRPFEIREIREFYEENRRQRENGEPVRFTIKEIARLFKIHKNHVMLIGKGIVHAHVPQEKDHPHEGRYPLQPTKTALASRAYRERKRKASE